MYIKLVQRDKEKQTLSYPFGRGLMAQPFGRKTSNMITCSYISMNSKRFQVTVRFYVTNFVAKVLNNNLIFCNPGVRHFTVAFELAGLVG